MCGVRNTVMNHGQHTHIYDLGQKHHRKVLRLKTPADESSVLLRSERVITWYLVLPFHDGFKQTLLGAVKRQTATQKDEENDPATPDVHRLPIRLSLDHFRSHEVRGPYTTYRETEDREASEPALSVHMICCGVKTHVPPATSPDSPSWMATPKPPSLTGAEFSLEASRTQ